MEEQVAQIAKDVEGILLGLVGLAVLIICVGAMILHSVGAFKE